MAIVLGFADAGTFLVRVSEKNGAPVNTGETLQLIVIDSKGRKSEYKTENAYFPRNYPTSMGKGRFAVNVSDCDDKSVTFKVWRNGGVIETKLERLNGDSDLDQIIDVIIDP